MSLSGGLIALVTVGGVRVLPGAWGIVSIGAVVITVAVFFLEPDRVYALAAGIGIGLDLWSAYPMFIWTVVSIATAFVAIMLFRSYITNRSLFAFVILGLVVQVTQTVSQFALTHLSALVFPNVVSFTPDAGTFMLMLEAAGIEVIALAVVFYLYARIRGRSSAISVRIPTIDITRF